jgi:hypothetical protein
MKKYISSMLAFLLIAFVVVACTGTEVPEQTDEGLMTSAVGSMVASFFGTQTAMYTPPSPTTLPTNTFLPTPTIQFPTATLGATQTATYIYYSPTPGTITPTGTLPTPTVNSASLAVGCNNLAFVRDVTVPAGTVLKPNQDFVKTWKVENIGTCDWMYQYIVVPAGGDTLGGKSTKIQKLVKVGNWTDLSVGMTAPNKPGKYTGYWRLSNGTSAFGATLTVSFTVSANPTDTPVPPTETPVTPAYPGP